MTTAFACCLAAVRPSYSTNDESNNGQIGRGVTSPLGQMIQLATYVYVSLIRLRSAGRSRDEPVDLVSGGPRLCDVLPGRVVDRPVGDLPADRCAGRAAAICERPELCTQRTGRRAWTHGNSRTGSLPIGAERTRRTAGGRRARGEPGDDPAADHDAPAPRRTTRRGNGTATGPPAAPTHRHGRSGHSDVHSALGNHGCNTGRRRPRPREGGAPTPSSRSSPVRRSRRSRATRPAPRGPAARLRQPASQHVSDGVRGAGGPRAPAVEQVTPEAEAGEAFACELIVPLSKRQSPTSHHLSLLTEIGLSRGERRRCWVWYSVFPERIPAVQPRSTGGRSVAGPPAGRRAVTNGRCSPRRPLRSRRGSPSGCRPDCLLSTRSVSLAPGPLDRFVGRRQRCSGTVKPPRYADHGARR
jgi:hypothetical protein